MFIKKISTLIFFIAFISCNTYNKKQELTSEIFPKQIGFVSDFSQLLLINQVELLEKRIDSFQNKTSNQIAIVIMDSVPYDINKYTMNLGNNWGVGQKVKDNGLVLLVAKNQRKIRISTGYGTEKILTDSICNQIIIKELTPNFREQKYYKGLNGALSSLFLKWQINE